jgi:transposase-like protein
MGEARRKFTKQYKADAVQLYQDSDPTMGQVAQQLGSVSRRCRAG